MTTLFDIKAHKGDIGGSICTPYKFNGKERDDETGYYYYGARYYDPQTALWLGVDPLAENYPDVSPYVYCAGNPVKYVDPDGRENIVVVGAQSDEDSGNKLMFVNQGIRAIRDFAENESTESRTMLLFQHGYTDKQIESIRNSVESYGGSLKLVNSVNDMIDYVNNANGNRSNDLVSHMELYSHGFPKSIEFGYNYGNNIKSSYSLNMSNVGDFQPSAFSTNALISSYACRTAYGKNNFAQNLASATGACVSAFERRTSYAGTLGSTLDRHPWMGMCMPTGAHSVSIPKTQMIDGAAFAPHGSNRGVVAGATPVGSSIFPIKICP